MPPSASKKKWRTRRRARAGAAAAPRSTAPPPSPSRPSPPATLARAVRVRRPRAHPRTAPHCTPSRTALLTAGAAGSVNGRGDQCEAGTALVARSRGGEDDDPVASVVDRVLDVRVPRVGDLARAIGFFFNDPAPPGVYLFPERDAVPL